MLATHPPSSSPPYAFAFLPPHPSPLSPRSVNIHGPRAYTSPSRMEHASGQENSKNNNIPFSKRAVKKAPSPKSDELKERRRNMFLRKVREGRDEKRFESRGEDVMRLDFMRRQRAWEAEQARDAPFDEPSEQDDDGGIAEGLPNSSDVMHFSQSSTQVPVPRQRDDEADELAQLEDQELEALLEYMPIDDDNDDDVQRGSGQNLWSDDDDYEELFSELMERDQAQKAGPSGEQEAQQDAQGEAMDMS